MNIKSKYSIKDLETLSGIKAHTIRIWEKRYQLFSPERSDTNIRFYSNEELKLLLNISLLNKHGYKISKILELSPQEMVDLLTGIQLVQSEVADLVTALVAATVGMNEEQFNRVFAAGIFKMGFERTVTEVLFPFFSRIGLMWQVGAIDPAQEHFISNLFRQKLIAAIDSLPSRTDKRALTVVLFLPENEMHELSLLFYNYALRSRGFHTVYLGQAVPIETLGRIVESLEPDLLLCTLTIPLDTEDLSTLYERMQKTFAGKILISGAGISEAVPLPHNMVRFHRLDDLLQRLES